MLLIRTSHVKEPARSPRCSPIGQNCQADGDKSQTQRRLAPVHIRRPRGPAGTGRTWGLQVVGRPARDTAVIVITCVIAVLIGDTFSSDCWRCSACTRVKTPGSADVTLAA